MYNLYCSKEKCLDLAPSLQKNVDTYIANPQKFSETLQFDEYTRDVVIYDAMNSINGLQNQEIMFDRRALYKVNSMDVLYMSNIEQILITRHALNVYNHLAFLEQCYCQCKTKCTTNRQTYKKHKRLGTRLLKLTSEFGSATDSLYLALFWYLDGKFKNSLELLQKNRERLCQEYIIYCNESKNKQAYTGKMQGKLMSISFRKI